MKGVNVTQAVSSTRMKAYTTADTFKISIFSFQPWLISAALCILEYFKQPTQFLNQQFRTDYLQPADRVHLYPSSWHVFQGWQVSILGMCFYSLAVIPPQAIPHCWVSLKLCARVSKILNSLVWNLLCAITLLIRQLLCGTTQVARKGSALHTWRFWRSGQSLNPHGKVAF